MAQSVIDSVVAKFGDKVVATSEHGDETITVEREHLLTVAEYLRTDSKLLFDSPVFVTCIDRLGLPEYQGNTDAHRFEVCYQLRSSANKTRVRLKIPLAENSAELPSLANMYPGFNWQERETFDMYGITFTDHGDLRRIYMYDEFVGYPLRKDYPKDKRQPLVRRDWD